MLRHGDTYISHAVTYIVVEKEGLYKLVNIVQREPVTTLLSKNNMVNFLKDPNNNLKQIGSGD